MCVFYRYVHDANQYKLYREYSKNQNILRESLRPRRSPDMVPTPITRHSTRASRVKVGPRRDMPWAMFSLTSS